MSTERIAAFLLKNLGRAGANDNRVVSDRELLRRFAVEHYERAFTQLVERHGALVWRVCHGIVANEHDAEDVFQAVFLVLSRKAASSDWRDSVANWLYETAHRLACKARAAGRRQAVRLGELEEKLSAPESPDDMTMREARAVLYEELATLPEDLRTPLVLCYLEGATREQAAVRLGWSQRTLERRLEQGRARLGKRLERRGIGLMVLLLTGGGLNQGVLGAGMPLGLAGVTVKAAMVFAVGGAAGAGVSAGAASLAEGALRSVLFSKGVLLAVVLTVAAAVAGGGLVLRSGKAPEIQPQEATKAASPPRTATAPRERVDLYGDPLPPGALMRLGSLRGRHASGDQSLTFTRDGKRLLLGGGFEVPRLCDVATGRLIREFDQIPKAQYTEDNFFPIFGTVLSPNERLLAVRSGLMGSIYLLDAATGRRLRELPCVKRVMRGYSCVFTPDSKAIAAQIDDRLELRDVATGRTLWQANDPEIRALACSPDGKLLASVRDKGGFRLWDARNGKLLRELVSEWQTDRIAFSPDGRTLVGSCYQEINSNRKKWSVRFWDVLSAYEMGSMGESEKSLHFSAFSPDGKMMATSGVEGIYLREISTGKELRRLPNTRYIGHAMAFSPDGKLLAGMDGPVVRFWDTASGEELPVRLLTGHEKLVTFAEFTPDGQTLISVGGDQIVRWWDTRTGRQQHSLTIAERTLRNYGFSRAVLSPDATRLAVSFAAALEAGAVQNPKEFRTGVSLLDAETGKEISRFDCGGRLPHKLVFSPDGKWLAQEFNLDLEYSPVVRLWDTVSGKRWEHELVGICPMFSPDGSILALLEPGRAIHCWETATGKKLSAIPLREDIRQVILSPDGQSLAAVTNQATIVLYSWSWDRDKGGRLGPPLRIAPPAKFVFALAFSPDGRILATGSGVGIQDDSTIYVWETASGKERARFTGHRSVLSSLAFSADGRRLASGSGDTTILIWDVAGRTGGGTRRDANLSDAQREKLWHDLAAFDAEQAGEAVWTLVEAGPIIVPWLAARLRVAVATLDQGQELLSQQEERQSPCVDVLRGVRAAEVLEHIGTSDAHRVLEELSRGAADVFLTREAQAAVKRFRSPARFKISSSVRDAATPRR